MRFFQALGLVGLILNVAALFKDPSAWWHIVLGTMCFFLVILDSD